MNLKEPKGEDTFQITSDPVTPAEARLYALELEAVLGEIANGRRKIGTLPLAHLCKLITYAKGAQ